MSLVEDLIRADAITAAATPKQVADRRDCLAAFGRLALGVARDNARLATQDRQARLRAVPRLSAFVNGRSVDGCRGIEPAALDKILNLRDRKRPGISRPCKRRPGVARGVGADDHVATVGVEKCHAIVGIGVTSTRSVGGRRELPDGPMAK